MRIITTISLLLITVGALPQQRLADSTILALQGRMICVEPQKEVRSADQTKIVISDTSYNASDPLLVIDGIPYEPERLKELDPNDIKSIDILKGNIFSCYSSRKDVIIITTKSSVLRKFTIKDVLNGQGVAGATLVFISSDKRDSLMFVADDNGVVSTDDLDNGKDYQVIVSSIGYKKLATTLEGNKQSEGVFLLERDTKECGEVIVTGISDYRKIICTMYVTVNVSSDSLTEEINRSDKLSVYPNPVQKGSTVTINIKSETAGLMNIRVLNLMGQLVSSQQVRAVKETCIVNVPVDRRWSAGTYIVQLADQSGHLVKTEKLIVQ